MVAILQLHAQGHASKVEPRMQTTLPRQFRQRGTRFHAAETSV